MFSEKIILRLRLSLTAVSLLIAAGCCSGCSSSGGGSATAPPIVSTPTYVASARFAYVNTGAGIIDEYSISTSGSWTKIGTASGTGASLGESIIASDPQHRFLYCIGGGNVYSTIVMFTISSTTGLLTPTVPASINIPGLVSQDLAVDGMGKYAYTADSYSNTTTSLSINQTTGVLTPTSVPSIASGTLPNGVTTDAAGKYVYVTDKNSASVSQFVIDPATGNLTANSPAMVSVGGGPFAGTISPAGTFYYSPGQGGSYINVLSLSPTTGSLSSSSTAYTGYGPTSVAITPNGKFAYVTNRTDSNVASFTVNPATGVLTSLGATVPPGFGAPTQIRIDAGGQLAYVVCQDGGVTIYGINSDGTLQQIATVVTDLNPETMVLVQ